MLLNMKKRIIDVNGINESAGKIQRSLLGTDPDLNLENVSINDLDEIVHNSENIALSCRQAIEAKEYREEDYFDEEYVKICTKDNPVTISSNDNVLRIKTPMTFKRMHRDGSIAENYLLMNYVSAAIKQYTTAHEDIFSSADIPLVAVIKRISNQFNSNKICDNDNLENGRIINTIMNAFGYSDNAMVMDIYSCFRLCRNIDDVGTEFIIAPYSKIHYLIEELKPQL